MADVYCDMSLDGSPLSGLNDGTSWANAYVSLETALDGVNVVAGDILYVKGSENVGSVNVNLIGAVQTYDDFPIVLGCKSATTAEPPATSDLIPGWRTGENRTEANRAYNNGDVPTITTTGSGDIIIDECVYFYGIFFDSASVFTWSVASLDALVTFEECFLSGSHLRLSATKFVKNCKMSWVTPDRTLGGPLYMDGVVWENSTSSTFRSQGSGATFASGCDFSDQAYTFLDIGALTTLATNPIILRNCKLHPNFALTTGTVTSVYRIEVYQCSSVTGKTTGESYLEYEASLPQGTISTETTAVRAGGANDGAGSGSPLSGSYSMALTPIVNGTNENYSAIFLSPEMFINVEGDNILKTLTVYISNSGAADYNDDDVWLEAFSPSDVGDARHIYSTTQMNLLGTPSAVTDDTSIWGTGGNNPQKLQVTINPSYTGRVYCRVHFAKRFAAAPETLFVDPLPEIT